MAATATTMATLALKCSVSCTPKHASPSKPTFKPISLLSLPNLPKGLIPTPSLDSAKLQPLLKSATAAAIFTSLSSCDPALAVQQIAEIAEGDSRGLALLLPIVPALLWVLYNILQPALNQINRMQSERGVIVGLGLGGLAASSFAAASPSASAGEIAAIADAAAPNDSRGLLLLLVIAPAVLWVLYNILQPALNQINRMRSG